MKKVSVIVPVFNSKQYLPRCIDSLRRQTLPELEIILVDDGSSDGSSGLCDEYASEDGRVQVLHQANRGAVAARKAGLGRATAKYVFFLDSDDWLEPEACALLYAEAGRSGAELVIGGHFLDGEDGSSLPRSNSLEAGFYNRQKLEQMVWPVLFHNDFRDEWSIYPYQWAKLFLREKLLPLQEQIDDGISLGEDACVTFSYVLGCQSMFVIHRPLYHYVQHPSSQFRARFSPKDLWTFRRIYKLVSAGIEENITPEELKGKLQEQLRIYLLTTILVPRSPWLLPGMEQMLELFPFEGVRRGSRVIVYGAGIFGTALQDFLRRTGFAECVLWLDARAAELRALGLEVYSLAEVTAWPRHDFLLVPLMKASTAAKVKEDLVGAGAEEHRIRLPDEQYVTGTQVWSLFGME